jgi:SNF2 family DNA or RNA helicase
MMQTFLYCYRMRGKPMVVAANSTLANPAMYAGWGKMDDDDFDGFNKRWGPLVEKEDMRIYGWKRFASQAIFVDIKLSALAENFDELDPEHLIDLLAAMAKRGIVQDRSGAAALVANPPPVIPGGPPGAAPAPVAQNNYQQKTEEWVTKLSETSTYELKRKPRFPYGRVTPLTLFAYQCQNVEWMVQRERNPIRVGYERVLSDHINGLYYDIARRICTTNLQAELNISGGALVDEMGLGKTLCALMLCVANRNRAGPSVHNGRIQARGTLIVLPNHLCGQWATEIQLILKARFGWKVVNMLNRHHFKRVTYKKLLDAEFVITSFQYLMSETIDDPFTSKLSSFYTMKRQRDRNRAKIYKTLVSEPDLIDTMANVSLYSVTWHRIIADEFHEVYLYVKKKSKRAAAKKAKTIAGTIDNQQADIQVLLNLLMVLEANHRWILSGTPFTDKRVDRVLGFLSGCPVDSTVVANDDLMELVRGQFRRNVYEGVKQEFTLPPVAEHVVRIPFSMAERVLYNSYVADHNNAYDDVYLRKLCCHPNLSEEYESKNGKVLSAESARQRMTQEYKLQLRNFKMQLQRKIWTRRLLYRKLAVLGEEVPDSDDDDNVRRAAFGISEKEKRKQKEEEDVRKRQEEKRTAKKEEKRKAAEKEERARLARRAERKRQADKLATKKKAAKRLPVKGKRSRLLQIDTDSTSDSGSESDSQSDKEDDDDESDVESSDDATTSSSGEEEGDSDSSASSASTAASSSQVSSSDDDDDDDDDGDFDFPQDDEPAEQLQLTLEQLKLQLQALNADVIKIASQIDGKRRSLDFIRNVMQEIKKEKKTCGICLDDIDKFNMGLTRCGHIYCWGCIKEWINTSPVCPYCQVNLKQSEVYNIVEAAKKKDVQKWGSKITYLIELLKTSRERTIIFSQWTGLLKEVGDVLKKNSIYSTFCKGNYAQKSKSLIRFRTDPKIRVLMMSTDTSASGANLVEASRIIFLDPVYAALGVREQIENQAIKRTIRLGQKAKCVNVYRLVIENTIEDDILKTYKGAPVIEV